MTLESIYFLASIAAAIAVTASLIFVGVQLRQQIREQRIVRATERSKIVMDFNRDWMGDPERRAAIAKAYLAPDELTVDERMVVEAFWRSNLMIHMITYAEVKNGFNDEELQVSGRAFSRLTPRNSLFDAWWEGIRSMYGPGFQRFFDDIRTGRVDHQGPKTSPENSEIDQSEA